MQSGTRYLLADKRRIYIYTHCGIVSMIQLVIDYACLTRKRRQRPTCLSYLKAGSGLSRVNHPVEEHVDTPISIRVPLNGNSKLNMQL